MSQGHAEIDTSVWTTQDGRTFKLTEMVDSHLRNTIRFLMAKLSASALADTPKETWKVESRKERERVLVQRLAALQAEAARRFLSIETPQ